MVVMTAVFNASVLYYRLKSHMVVEWLTDYASWCIDAVCDRHTDVPLFLPMPLSQLSFCLLLPRVIPRANEVRCHQVLAANREYSNWDDEKWDRYVTFSLIRHRLHMLLVRMRPGAVR